MLKGLPVSPGIAVGRALIIRFGGLPAFRRAVEAAELDREERRLRRAAGKAAEDFSRHSREAKGDIGSELAAAIRGRRLHVSTDGQESWVGELPVAAFQFDGPVGVRSDNADFSAALRAEELVR